METLSGIGKAFLCLIGIAYFVDLFYVLEIYPASVKDRIKKRTKYKVLNRKFKVLLWRYISSCFLLSGFVLCGIAFLDFGWHLVPVIVWGIIIVLDLFRILYLFPRRYIIFKDKKMYYHNGFREICIDEINMVNTFRINYKSWYWYMYLKCDGKWVVIDVLLFDEPEKICSMIDRIIE